jgi:hypothetical protein
LQKRQNRLNIYKTPEYYEEGFLMVADPTEEFLAKLTTDQRQRFDDIYVKKAKTLKVARVLSFPLIGTFGIQFFYLGDILLGFLSIVFSLAFIPAILALINVISVNTILTIVFFIIALLPTIYSLFELITNGIQKYISHANYRIAKQTSAYITRTTPLTSTETEQTPKEAPLATNLEEPSLSNETEPVISVSEATISLPSEQVPTDEVPATPPPEPTQNPTTEYTFVNEVNIKPEPIPDVVLETTVNIADVIIKKIESPTLDTVIADVTPVEILVDTPPIVLVTSPVSDLLDIPTNNQEKRTPTQIKAEATSLLETQTPTNEALLADEGILVFVEETEPSPTITPTVITVDDGVITTTTYITEEPPTIIIENIEISTVLPVDIRAETLLSTANLSETDNSSSWLDVSQLQNEPTASEETVSPSPEPVPDKEPAAPSPEPVPDKEPAALSPESVPVEVVVKPAIASTTPMSGEEVGRIVGDMVKEAIGNTEGDKPSGDVGDSSGDKPGGGVSENTDGNPGVNSPGGDIGAPPSTHTNDTETNVKKE